MTPRVEKLFSALLVAPAFIPLIFIDGLLYPYETPKSLLLRGIAILLLAVFAYLLCVGRSFYFARLKVWQTWVPFALLCTAYLASIFGVDFYHSFWSTFERGDGLLTMTALVIYFYIFLLSAEKPLIGAVMRVIAWVASGIALYAVLQWLQSLSGVDWPLIATPNGRIGSTLGNAAYLASYLGAALFITVAALRSYSGRTRGLLLCGIVLQVVAIFLTATRGTIVALLLVGGGYLIYRAVTANHLQKRAQVLLVVILLLVGLFIGFRQSFVTFPFEPVQRLASISLSDSDTASRLFLATTLSRVALEHPVLGVGAEHVEVLFNRIYDPGALVEQWFDRSHDIYLDYLLQFGFIGLGIYMLLLYVLFAGAFTLARRQDSNGLPFILLGAAYVIQGLFVFEIATTSWVLYLVLAIILVSLHDGKKVSSPVRVPWGWAAIAAALISLVSIPIVLLPLYANILLAIGYKYQVFDSTKTVQAISKGFSLGTYADLEYGYQTYEMYVAHQQYQLAGDERLSVYRMTKSILESNNAKYPYDARTAVYLGDILTSAPPGESVDESALVTLLQKAIALSPKRSQAWFMYANIYLLKARSASAEATKIDNYKKSIAILEQYAETVPTAAEPRYILATLYLTLHSLPEAERWADEALALYVPDALVARRAASYYVLVQDWPHAERMLTDVVTSDPTDVASLYDLAKAAFLADHKDQAVTILHTLEKEAPAILPQDPEFLKAITAYEKSR